jgi:ribosomal protein S18 acetylase RimI-like enzyme
VTEGRTGPDETSTSQITLRRPTRGDLAAIAAIEAASFADPWSEAEFASVLETPHTIFLVAETGKNSGIVG